MAFFAGVAGLCVAVACLSRMHGDTCVEIYVADWCPHCRAIAEEIGKLVSDADGYSVVVYEDGTAEATKMQSKRGVTSFPTIILRKGSDTQVYTGPRTFESIKAAALA